MMLEGIQILSETTKWTANGWDIFGGIFCGLMSLGLLTLIILGLKKIGWSMELIMPILLTLVLGFMSVTLFASYVNKTSYPEYKVTVDDDVSLTEFNQKYKITSQEGRIYTIQEKSE